MNSLRPVIWTKGAVLTPQHLQAQDRFAQGLLAFHLEHFHPRSFGFTDLELEHRAAGIGKTYVSVKRAAGILPDGTPFSVPEAGSTPEAVLVDGTMLGSGDGADVYLVLPPFREGGVNVSFNGARPDSRFTADLVSMKDENDSRINSPVLLASKNFRLAAERHRGDAEDDAPEARRPRLQIARFYSAGEEMKLDLNFSPPVLNLSVSPVLKGLLEDIVHRMAAKIDEFGRLRVQKSTTLAEFHASDAPIFWLLHSLNSHYPVLRHYAESNQNHPEPVFVALSKLASTLTVYSGTVTLNDIPVYDHSRPGECFSKICTQLQELLGVVIPRPYVSVTLTRVSGGLYTCNLNYEWLKAKEVYLSILSRPASPKQELQHDDLVSRVQLQAKVGAKDRAQSAGVYATNAIPLIFKHGTDIRLPLPREPIYFLLDLTSPSSSIEWGEVRRAGGLDVRLPPDIPDPELELILVLPQGAGKSSL